MNIVAEVEVVYKNKVKSSERPSVKFSKDGHHFLKLTWDENEIEFVEQFKVVLLNRVQRVLKIYHLSTVLFTELRQTKIDFYSNFKSKYLQFNIISQSSIGQP